MTAYEIISIFLGILALLMSFGVGVFPLYNDNKTDNDGEQTMIKSKLVLANYDARISKIDIKPKNKYSKVIVFSQMFNEETNQKENTRLVFIDVAIIDFYINFFDNMIGTEAMGLYEIEDIKFVERLAKENFERRKEIYLLEGDYNYDENDACDMLNSFDITNFYSEEKSSYHAYVQNVDAGVYIIVAKELQIVR